MRNPTRNLTFLLSVLFFPFLLVEHIPAVQSSNTYPLFIFGDSLADNGNNNYLPTLAKCNYPPYGYDYPYKEATGRWTNDENVIDFLAGYLNPSSPPPPPFYSIKSQLEYKNCTGVNFASGSCGILPITGFQYLACSNFDMQVENFKAALDGIKYANFPNNQTAFNEYMSQSICVIVIGNNDYINNYFSPFPLYSEYKNYTCSQFAEILASNMTSKVQELYSLCCTKFIVANVAAVGCCPYERMASGSPPNTCNETQNNCVNLYNEKLRVVLTNLAANHTEVKYIYADIWSIARDCTINPSSCGFLNSSSPCCTTYANGTCMPTIPGALPNVPSIPSLVCPNRSTHLFWDSFHPSNDCYFLIYKRCTDPTNPYYPSPCDKPLSYLL